MRCEGESYKRKISNSYPQDLIPCSASTTQSLIDLLPLRYQLSELGCSCEWRLLVFAVNVRKIRKAWANKRDGLPCKALGFLDTFLVVSPPPPRMELIVCPGAPAPGFCSHGAGESTAGCIAA